MRDDIRDFFGHGSKKGYVAKLLAKKSDVERKPAAVAAALGVDATLQWMVACGMVTRHPVPAAFTESDVPFVTADRVLELLRT